MFRNYVKAKQTLLLYVGSDADRNEPVPMQIGAVNGRDKGKGKGKDKDTKFAKDKDKDRTQGKDTGKSKDKSQKLHELARWWKRR